MTNKKLEKEQNTKLKNYFISIIKKEKNNYNDNYNKYKKNIDKELYKIKIEKINKGITNSLFRIKLNRKTYIIKQFNSRNKLNKVIKLPISRYKIERKALKYISEKINIKIVPKIIKYDDKNKIIIMEDLGQNKDLQYLIIKNKLQLKHYAKIGKAIAEIHSKTYNNKKTKLSFNNNEFQNIKIKYRYNDVIDKNKDFKELRKIKNELIKKTKKNRICLLHNDLKPNNIFINKNNIKFIDFEGSYFGEPSFEMGYILAHLIVLYIHLKNKRILNGIKILWKEYIKTFNLINLEDLEKDIIKHIAFIILFDYFGLLKSEMNFLKIENQKSIINKVKKILFKAKKLNHVLNIIAYKE